MDFVIQDMIDVKSGMSYLKELETEERFGKKQKSRNRKPISTIKSEVKSGKKRN